MATVRGDGRVISTRVSFGRRRALGGGWRTLVLVIAAILAAVLPPALSIAAVLGVAALLVFLSNPMLGIYALFFAVPFESVRNIQAGGINITITEFAVFCVTLAWLGRVVTLGRVDLNPTPWRWPLLAYGLVITLSITQASDLVLSIKEWLKWGELLFAYLVGVSLVRTRADVRRFLVVLFVAVLAESSVGIGQAVLHSGPSSFARGAFLRASGTFEQPNPFAGYLNMTLPLAVALLAYRAFPRRWMWLVVAVTGGSVLASLSRGGELASIGALCTMGLLAAPRLRPLMGAAAVGFMLVIVGVVIGLVPSTVTDPLAQQLGVANVDVINPNPIDWPVAERLAHMQAGLNMWADHPLLGVGIGNYAKQYDHYKVADVWKDPLGHAHNYYINIGAEAGLLGLVAFLVLIGGALVIAIRAFRHATDPLDRAVALGGAGVMVGIAIHSFFDDIFVHGMEVQMALVMVAVSRVRVAYASRSAWPSTRVAGLSPQGEPPAPSGRALAHRGGPHSYGHLAGQREGQSD